VPALASLPCPPLICLTSAPHALHLAVCHSLPHPAAGSLRARHPLLTTACLSLLLLSVTSSSLNGVDVQLGLYSNFSFAIVRLVFMALLIACISLESHPCLASCVRDCMLKAASAAAASFQCFCNVAPAKLFCLLLTLPLSMAPRPLASMLPASQHGLLPVISIFLASATLPQLCPPSPSSLSPGFLLEAAYLCLSTYA